MFRNYLVVTLRGLLRRRLYTSLEVGGLGLGMAVCLLALVYFRAERTWDRSHARADRTYLMRSPQMEPGARPTKQSASTPGRLAPVLTGHFPEVEATVRFTPVGFVGAPIRVGRGERVLYRHGHFADPGVFEVFTFRPTAGRLPGALDDPASVVLSAEAARQLFAGADPIGQPLTIWRSEQPVDFTVTAVVDVPVRSSIRFDFLLSTALLAPDDEPWEQANYQTFALLREGASPADLTAKLRQFLPRYAATTQTDPRDWGGFGSHPAELVPLTDLHLSPHLRWYLGDTSHPAYSRILLALAIVVLTIACVNFAELSVATATSRARQIAVRKVLGSSRAQLARQLLGEAAVASAAGLVLAIALAEAFLPRFAALVEQDLSIDYARDWPLLFGIAAATAVAAGAYPALVLSALPPTAVLRRRLRLGGSPVVGRILMGLQFTCSIALISAAVLMARQVRFLATRDLGFEPEGALLLDGGPTGRDWYGVPRELVDTYRAQVGRHGIADVSATNIAYGTGDCCEGRPLFADGRIVGGGTLFKTDGRFLATMGLDLVEGRDFDPGREGDEDNSLLINEAMVRFLGWDTAVGRTLPEDRAPQRLTGDKTVIGVVRDFHYEPLQRGIAPAVLHLSSRDARLRYVVVRVRPGDLRGTLAWLEAEWRRVLPDRPFVYTFLDEDVARSLRAETGWLAICRAAAVLAVFVAALGVFGLSCLAAERRTREIGIRKAMGASVASVVSLLNRELTWLVLAASAIAWPAAWYGLSRWLEGYAYRVDLGAGVFVAAGATALLIAWLASSWEAVRAARANPVDALRVE